MRATPENPSRCPVTLFKTFLSCRPPETRTPESPLYLSINHKWADYSYWYKKQPLGVNYIDRMMKSVVQGTSVTGRKMNHSARKTMVETLCWANIPDSTVMQLSGHKNVQSLNHYKNPSLEQQKSISHLLSNQCSTSECPAPSCSLSKPSSTPAPSSSSSTESAAAHVPGPFSNATFTNCSFVLNFGGPSQQVSSYSSSVTSSISAPVRRKRLLVIDDSRDEG